MRRPPFSKLMMMVTGGAAGGEKRYKSKVSGRQAPVVKASGDRPIVVVVAAGRGMTPALPDPKPLGRPGRKRKGAMMGERMEAGRSWPIRRLLPGNAGLIERNKP